MTRRIMLSVTTFGVWAWFEDNPAITGFGREALSAVAELLSRDPKIKLDAGTEA